MRQSGHVAAIVGAVMGALVLAMLSWSVTTAVAALVLAEEPGCDRYSCNVYVRAGICGFYGFVFGWWIGAGLGSWAMLRLLRHSHAALTGVLAAPVHFIFSLMTIGVSAAFLLAVRILSPEPLVAMYLLLFGLLLPFEVVTVSAPVARHLAVEASKWVGPTFSPSAPALRGRDQS